MGDEKRKFLVLKREVWVREIEVEAENAEDAAMLADEGIGAERAFRPQDKTAPESWRVLPLESGTGGNLVRLHPSFLN